MRSRVTALATSRDWQPATAYDNGAEVRDAASAYASKQAKKKKKEAANHGKKRPLWEVFIRSKAGLSHKHAGSLHAPDAEMAISNARDVYTRRSEGISIWVVGKYIHATQGSDSAAMFEPTDDKVYRHPTL